MVGRLTWGVHTQCGFTHHTLCNCAPGTCVIFLNQRHPKTKGKKRNIKGNKDPQREREENHTGRALSSEQPDPGSGSERGTDHFLVSPRVVTVVTVARAASGQTEVPALLIVPLEFAWFPPPTEPTWGPPTLLGGGRGAHYKACSLRGLGGPPLPSPKAKSQTSLPNCVKGWPLLPTLSRVAPPLALGDRSSQTWRGPATVPGSPGRP